MGGGWGGGLAMNERGRKGSGRYIHLPISGPLGAPYTGPMEGHKPTIWITTEASPLYTLLKLLKIFRIKKKLKQIFFVYEGLTLILFRFVYPPRKLARDFF